MEIVRVPKWETPQFILSFFSRHMFTKFTKSPKAESDAVALAEPERGWMIVENSWNWWCQPDFHC